MALIQKLNGKADELRQTFRSRGWEKIGLDIKRYVVPDRGRLLQGKTESKSNDYDKSDRAWVVDDTGEQANNFLVSGFMGMLTPNDTFWFQLTTGNPELQKIKRVGIWLDDVSELMHTVMRNSDVYSSFQSSFTELFSFGTAAQILFEDEVDTILPVSLTWGEYLIGTNGKNEVDTIMREFYMTAQQMKDQFGEDKLCKQVKHQLKNTANAAEKRIRVMHLIEPNDGRRGVSNPADMPVNSLYWDEFAKDGDEPLSVSGFEEFPAQVPRSSTISNDTYGKESPGMKQLSNIKALQSVVRDTFIISKRMGDPPLVSDINAANVSNLPGRVNMLTDSTGQTSGIQPLFQNYNPRVDYLYELARQQRELIEKGFFNPLFLNITNADSDRMTATEVVARNEEKFAMLGPILNRVYNNLLKPTIDRIFNILTRQGFFDGDGLYPFPPELSETELDIEYTSILAQAQQAVGLNNLDRFVERVGILMQLDPSVIDNVDMDAIIRRYGKTVPAEAFVEVEEMIAAREAQAAQQAAMAQMAAMESGAQVSKDLSQAKLGQNSALDALAEEEG